MKDILIKDSAINKLNLPFKIHLGKIGKIDVKFKQFNLIKKAYNTMEKQFHNFNTSKHTWDADSFIPYKFQRMESLGLSKLRI